MPAAISGQDEMPAQVAAKIAREPVIYVLGSGPNEDVARCLAMCYLRVAPEVLGVPDAATAAGG